MQTNKIKQNKAFIKQVLTNQSVQTVLLLDSFPYVAQTVTQCYYVLDITDITLSQESQLMF